MGDRTRSASRQRRQWGQSDQASDLSLRQMTDSQTMEASDASGGFHSSWQPSSSSARRLGAALKASRTSTDSGHSSLEASTDMFAGQNSHRGMHSSQSSREGDQAANLASVTDLQDRLWESNATGKTATSKDIYGSTLHGSQRHNLTCLELDLLRDSLVELDLNPETVTRASAAPGGGGRIEEQVEFSEDEISEADSYSTTSFDEYDSPQALRLSSSSELRVMEAAGPARVQRQLPNSRPVSGRHPPGTTAVMAALAPHRSPVASRPTTSGSLRPLSGAPARPKPVPKELDADLASIAAAVSAENKAVLRSSAAKRPVASETTPKAARRLPTSTVGPQQSESPTMGTASARGNPRHPRAVDVPASRLSHVDDSAETPGAAIKKISSRLARLAPDKQRVLQQVLDKLEKAEASGAINVSAMFSSLGQEGGAAPRPRGAPSLAGAKHTSAAAASTPEGTEHQQEIVLRLLSSQGGGREVGLTEVELSDSKGDRVEVLPDDLRLRGAADTSNTLPRILSGRTKTINERHMWTGSLPPSGRPLEIVMRTAPGSPVASRLLVWNFNKSIPELGRGVKEMQVYVDGKLTWQGSISRGCGNQTFDYATKIALTEQPKPTSPHTPECTASVERNAPSGNKADDEASSRAPPSAEAFAMKATRPLDELSNEELLEELRRRSLPVTPMDKDSRSAQAESASLVSKKQPSPPQENEPLTTQLSRGSSSGQEDESPPKPGLKSKLDDLRSRLSARRGGAPPVAPSSTKQAAAEPADDTGVGPEGRPVWLPNDGKTGNDSEGPATAGRRAPGSALHSLLERRRRGSDPGEEPALRPSGPSGEQQPLRSGRRRPSDSGESTAGVPFEDTQQTITATGAQRSRPASGRRRFGSAERATAAPPGMTDASEPVPTGATTRPVRMSTGVDASLDSLEFFTRTQAGRLEKALAKAKRSEDIASPRVGEKVPVNQSIDDVDALINAELSMAGLDDDEALIQDELALFAAEQSVSERNQTAAGTSAEFVIPERPSGRVLKVSIFTTWGDPHYVGMCGLELFDSRGQPIRVYDPQSQVSAEPSSINELSEYSADPRTPDKLVDNTYMTCDDLHVWLAPFTPGIVNHITIRLDAREELGMLRVWNYNKSRIHSQRGARQIEVKLDSTVVFKGEVSRAPGSMAEAPANAECILFTNDEAALLAIEQHDEKYARAQAEESQQRTGTPPGHEPSRAAPSPLEIVTNDTDDPLGMGLGKVGSDGRPMTSAVHVPAVSVDTSAQPLASLAEEPAAAAVDIAPSAGAGHGIKGRELKLVVLSTWGDPYYMGLTGLQVYGADGQPLPLSVSSLNACPRDLNAIPGYSGDDRTLDKLLDGVNVTTNDQHMWLAPMKMSTLSGGPVSAEDPNGWLSVTFGPSAMEITGIRVWNYNKSKEDANRGLKAVHLVLDGQPLSAAGGHLLAKAPGHSKYDFAQYLPIHTGLLRNAEPVEEPGSSGFDASREAAAWINSMPDPAAAAETWRTARKTKNHSMMVRQDFDTPLLPCGFIFKILLLNSWGDPHYVGLTGLQIVDAVRGPIQIPASAVSAFPRSVADLPGMNSDVRLPARLVDRPNSSSPSHSWLAPVAADRKAGDGVGSGDDADQVNTVNIRLDTPVMLAAIRLWNYAKNPERGAQEIEVMLDDLLIFKGYVRPAPTSPQMPWQHSILFHNDPGLLDSERHGVYSHLATMEREGPIVLVNERQFMPGSAKTGTYVTPGVDRPSTSVVAR